MEEIIKQVEMEGEKESPKGKEGRKKKWKILEKNKLAWKNRRVI